MKKIKKKKSSNSGCLVAIILFIIFIVLGVKFMGENYDRLEKSSNKERFDKMMVFFNSNDEYQDLSITQKKTITVKLFLLGRCRGGEETLNKLIQYILLLKGKESKVDEKKLFRSIESTKFDVLKKKENDFGFDESIKVNDINKSFFFLGPENKWQNKLPNDILKKIENEFQEDLKYFNY